MKWVVLLLLCGAKCLGRGKPILTPQYVDVFEMSSVKLTCIAHMNETTTQWGTFIKSEKYSDLTFSEEGECSKTGFLGDTRYFQTECYSNATFIVRIIHANSTNHGQEWYCSSHFKKSNTAYITVKGLIHVVESMKYTITCDASEGRPVARISIKQTLHTEKGTGIRNDMPNDNFTTGISVVKDLTTVHSSIDIIPKREDNNSRLICATKNGNFTEDKIQAMLLVQYPPNKPIFVIGGKVVNGSVPLISGSNVSILCKSDSYPSPTYHWNSTGISKDGPYLNLASLFKNETWQCTSKNNMKLPNKKTINGTSSSIINIYYSTEILHFMITKNAVDGSKFIVNTNEEISFMCSSGTDHPFDIVIKRQDGTQLTLTKNTTSVRHKVQRVSCNDAGIYICSAKDMRLLPALNALSKLTLIVKCPPAPANKYKGDGTILSVLQSDVTLQFEVLGFFDEIINTVFMWYKQNISLPNDGRKYIITSNGIQSNLIIRNTAVTDFGQYKVVVSNSYGQYIHHFELEEKVYQLEQSIFESTTARILLVAVGTFGFIIVVGVVVTIRSRRIRRRRSDRIQTEQIAISTDAVVNQIPSIEDDTVDDAHYQEIIVYEHLDQQLTEREDYVEMQSIQSEDSNKYYITPIHY